VNDDDDDDDDDVSFLFSCDSALVNKLKNKKRMMNV